LNYPQIAITTSKRVSLKQGKKAVLGFGTTFAMIMTVKKEINY
jgi:hypothetical protein